jgi:uroporphyrin-III C-methyltransferase
MTERIQSNGRKREGARGRVYLVGSGPGDPELLTLKALRLLQAADVVLHDELVSRAILELAPRNAVIRNVGRRCAAKPLCQENIHAWMVDYASAGLTVIRLKGGDPMLFGRADQEIAALRAAEIQVEVVPGITAALAAAAAAQLPLTQRYHSSAVILTTYRRAANQPPAEWQSMIASGATIVLYMPGDDYSSFSRELRQAGLSGETPCLIASQASTLQEVLLTTTLDQLSQLAPLPAPAVLILGAVGRLAAAGNPASYLGAFSFQ